MKIIIAGAGDVGFHLAKLLSYESQDTYIIDFDGERLEYINNHLDVITQKGDATSIKLLKEIGIHNADLLIAVTDSQNTNFTISVIGKSLGVGKTIARIDNPEFLNDCEVDFSKFGVDFMISPQELAANEIKMLLNQSSFNDTVEFESGIFNVMGTSLTYQSPLVDLTVKEARQKFANIDYITIAIKREHVNETIIPRGDTRYELNDQVYFSVPNYSMKDLNPILGRKQFSIKNVMILGGSSIGEKTARHLCEDNFKVKQLMKFKGVGVVKAITIKTALELGKRRQLESALERPKITSSKDVFQIMQPTIGDLNHEEFWVLFLNNSNKVLDKSQVSKGGLTATIVDIRLLFKRALELASVAMIVCHNHPSGKLVPSNSDKQLTQKIKNAGETLDIKLLDHLIVTEKSYFSFADEGIL